MNTLTVIGQIFGFVAMALIVWSFQFKDNKKLFLLQVGSCTFFVLHYLFLGLGGDPAAYSGMAQNFVGLAFRAVLLLGEKHKKLNSTLVMAVFCAVMAVLGALTYSGDPVALLPVVGNIICVGALWTRDANLIRFGQLIAVSPCWLTYNVFMLSIAGILLESFNIISIIVYYIRRRINKKRAQEPQEKLQEETEEKELTS